MSQLIVLVIHDPAQVDDVIHAWVEAGVGGLTIFDSSGLAQRVQGPAIRDDLPLFPSLRSVMRGQEAASRTVFSVVPDDFDVDRLVQSAEAVIGSLDDDHSGILFVVPVSRVVGLQDRSNGPKP
jgi:nitrogen regulatory protein PII